MKKLMAVLCAVVMAFGMTATVFALPSVVVDGVITGVSATDASGNAVAVVLGSVSSKYQSVVSQASSAVGSGMQVVDVKEISIPEGVTGALTMTFDVTGIKAGQTVQALVYVDGQWKEVTATATEDGKVVVTVDAAAEMIAIATEKTADSSSAGTGGSNTNAGGSTGTGSSSGTGTGSSAAASATSPKTGESGVIAVAALLAVAALGGMIYAKKANA